MSHIPHSTFDDEARFIVLITQLIKDGELPKSKTWEKSVKDEKAKLVRKKQGEKEAKEAEDLAKELGVWDEFYGSGKEGPRKSKGKGKAAKDDNKGGDDDDTSVLQALILKRKKDMDGFFDNLAAKYAEPEPKSKSKKGKKRAKDDEEEFEQASGKKSRQSPPDIDDAEFEKLQQKLFGDKSKGSEKESGGKPAKAKSRGRKAK